MYFWSLSIRIDICSLKDDGMSYSLSSVDNTADKLICRYLKHLHVAKTKKSKVFIYPVSPSLEGYIATDTI